MKKSLYIISLGGSLIVPEEIDVKFLIAFRHLILKQAAKGSRFIIMTGGGRICRKYQQALRGIIGSRSAELDWIGIYSTRFNGQLVRLMFGQAAHPHVIDDPNKKVLFKEKILVAAGWKPGRSTDDDAVRLAKIYGANTIINLSNIDHVYTKDPRKFKNAQPIIQIAWKDFRKIVGSKWDPGKNAPFDPVAAKFAQRHAQRVIIVNGANLKNLEKVLAKKSFIGTVVS